MPRKLIGDAVCLTVRADKNLRAANITVDTTALLDGVLKTMFRTQLKKAAAWVLAVGCGGMLAYYALIAVLAFAAVATVKCRSFAADDAPKAPAPLIRYTGSGLRSAAGTWEGGKV